MKNIEPPQTVVGDAATSVSAQPVRPSRAKDTLEAIRHSGSDHVGLAASFAVLFVFLSLRADNFLTKGNLFDVLREASFTGIIAFAMTLVIVAAEIDISVGSAIGFASAFLGVLAVSHGWGLLPASLLVLVVGTAIGLLAGAIRAKFNVPSFIVTLALFSILRGLALLITNAVPVSIDSNSFAKWGSGDWAGIPIPAIIMAITFLLFWGVATRTRFGRSVYAIGGNSEAAHLSGIPVARVRIILFGLTGVMSAISGILQSSQLGAGNPSIGAGVEFAVISAVIVGGASLYGGRGSMVGTLLGVLFIAVLNNGMVLLGVNSYAQNVAQGLIVLLAVLVSALRPSARSRTNIVRAALTRSRAAREPSSPS